MDRSIMNSEPKADFRRVVEQDADYPEPLRELEDRPPVLYIKGRWPLPEACAIGIVGTRHASPYGLEVTKRFTADLVQKDVLIVSGLAAGIDACAHRATLQGGGWTVAVLGHGFNYRYPAENASLFEEIEKRGTLITEFACDIQPDARNFPRRNRIISGLSRGVLVVEAGHRSGASITARCAAEQGRDVFAVPGSIFSPQSLGCHRLLKHGAQLVETAEDILEVYGLTAPRPAPVPTPVPNDAGLTSDEKDVARRLSEIPLSVDELIEISGLAFDRLAEVLLSLELKGRIRPLPGQRYVA
jgi:DNA processing protein